MNATINNHQLKILRFLTKNEKGFSTEEIVSGIKTSNTRYSIIRDINTLKELRYVEAIGKARSTKYKILANTLKFQPLYDLEEYTAIPVDNRHISYISPLSVLGNNFNSNELMALTELKSNYKTIEKMSDISQKKLWERFVIDLSWKSSAMEGNTYSILETERLLKEGIKGEGKSDFETKMVLNHKSAFDFVRSNQSEFGHDISFAVIEHVHKLLSADLGIPSGFRKIPVGISGSLYKPNSIPYLFKEQIEQLMSIIKNESDPLSQALSIVAGISYIQPFEDGNKRTSRLVANGVLMCNGYPPLSYRAIDEFLYKKAVVTYYEQANIYHLKEIFKEQLLFSSKVYFE